jgi:hypothetical protein
MTQIVLGRSLLATPSEKLHTPLDRFMHGNEWTKPAMKPAA